MSKTTGALMKEILNAKNKAADKFPDAIEVKHEEVKVETVVESSSFQDGARVVESTPVTDQVVTTTKAFAAKPNAWISYEAGGNVNLGNYNMAKVKVSITLPVGREISPEIQSQIDSTFSNARNFVEKKLEEEVKKLRGLNF